MPLLDLPQRSPEWLEARRGKITASLAAACLGLDRHKGPLAAFNEIMGRATQQENRAMRWGTNSEGFARQAYECESGNLVEQTGLWVHDSLPWLAASPDGLIGTEGLVEIKCPGIIPSAIPANHAVQMTVQLACTGRSWCDYFAWSQEGHFLYRIDFKPRWWEELVADLESWYTAHILADVPPPRRRKASA